MTDACGVEALAKLYKILAVPVSSLLLALTELREVATIIYGQWAPAKDVYLLDKSLTLLREKISLACKN